MTFRKTIVCKACNDVCEIDGDYPKFFAWCEKCDDYAEGFDVDSYCAEYMSDQVDAAQLLMEDRYEDRK